MRTSLSHHLGELPVGRIMNKLGLGMQWLLGDSTYRPYILSTSTTRALLWLEMAMNLLCH